MELKSEFAHVRVTIDSSGNGPRLKIEDIKTGQAMFLDPLELETLAWLRHEDLRSFMDPSSGRWMDPGHDFEESIARMLSRFEVSAG